MPSDDRPSRRTRRLPTWAPRWPELIPELVLVAGLTIFLLDEPDAATSAFTSTRAVFLMAAGVIVWVVGRIVIARFVHPRAIGTALFGVAAVAVLAVVVLPAYDDDTVVEAFPIAPPATVDETPTTIAVPPAETAAPEPTVTPTPTSGPTPDSAPTTVPSPPETTQPVPIVEDDGPELLRTAMFQGVDHRAAGTVSLYRTADGRHVVGLEQFDIQPGPDYDLYLVPGADRRDRDGGTRLDDLRGNQGTQYYEVPTAIEIGSDSWTVLVWCQTFGVPVANATPV